MQCSERIEMTREEFYTLIWNTPITRLLKEYELTEQSITNICTRYNIPNSCSNSKTQIKSGIPVSPPPLLEFNHPIYMIVTPLTVDRALRIMDSLIKALEKRGFQVIVEPSESPH